MLKALRRGSVGALARSWNYFLRGEGYPVVCDDDFTEDTEAATRAWQALNGFVGGDVDGIVGPKTAAKAVARGWAWMEPVKRDPGSILKPLSPVRKAELFGKFSYTHAPTALDPEAVRVVGDWKRQHIVQVQAPRGDGLRENLQLHRLIVPQFEAVMRDIAAAGLVGRIVDWNGSYVARFIRGRRDRLSSHAYGTAVDINADWNRRGATPAALGQPGSVLELVPIFAKHGWAWGGHFEDRVDGMHFEVAELRA